MTILDQAKQHIFEKLIELIGNDSLINDIVIDYPPQNDWGDLTVACFVLAKIHKCSPADMAKDLASKLSSDAVIDKIEAKGPYLNFFLKNNLLFQVVDESLKKDCGFSQEHSSERIMIEYSNANTHKEYHVGHLRNICYGDSVASLFLANGYKVDRVSYINDFGIHAAKTLWQFKKNQNSIEGGYVLGRLYSEASRALEDNETGKAEVAEIMKQIEDRNGDDYKLWQETRRWSIDYFDDIYNRLKIKFDQVYYESEVIDEGRELAFKLLEQGILQKSQGAVIADLSQYDLGVLVFLRSDGTALYPVGDLALASKKFSKTNLSQSLYVVDVRQSLYFQQLFKVLELAGYQTKMVHLVYDFVKLPQGAMSSRLGLVVSFDEVYQEAKNKIVSEITKRHQDWSDKKIEQTAEAMTIGVLKFEMIKVGADKIITFNINEALRFDGFTSVYLQYTGARINSLLKKGHYKFDSHLSLAILTEAKERELILFLSKFTENIKEATRRYEPSILAKYLFDLSRVFNDYYQTSPIIQDNQDLQNARLTLVASVLQVLTNGLAILGIAIIEEM